MANSLDLQKEGVVESKCKTEDLSESENEEDSVSESNAEISDRRVIESNIKRTTAGSDSDDIDGDETKETSNDTIKDTKDKPHTTRTPDESSDDSEDDEELNQQQGPNDNNNQIDSTHSSKKYIIYTITIIFLAIYFGGYEPPLPPPESLPICSRMPDPSTKYKLQCPKCDAFEEGKCMMFVPYSSQQTSINAKGTYTPAQIVHITFHLARKHTKEKMAH